MMTRLDGEGPLERLRADARWADLPVGVVSAAPSPARCRELGWWGRGRGEGRGARPADIRRLLAARMR